MGSSGNAEDKFITVNNIRLHYLDWGNKEMPALIFLPGLSQCAHEWDYIASSLQGQYHCLAVDQRGQGDSQRADSYKGEDFAADIAGIVDALELGKVSVLGLSLGGRTAIFYAGSHPEKVAKLIIIDIGPEIDTPRFAQVPPPGTRNEFGSVADLVDFLRQRDPSGQEERMYQYATHVSKKLPDGKLTYKHDPKMEESVMKIVMTGEDADVMWQLLARIKCPTLIIRGADSPALSPMVAKRMAAAMPRAELVEIEGSSHFITFDKPEEVRQVVVRFLEQAEE